MHVLDDVVGAAHQAAQDAADLRAVEGALHERDEGPDRDQREQERHSYGERGRHGSPDLSASRPIVASANSE